jgi:hypothetical protein
MSVSIILGLISAVFFALAGPSAFRHPADDAGAGEGRLAIYRGAVALVRHPVWLYGILTNVLASSPVRRLRTGSSRSSGAVVGAAHVSRRRHAAIGEVPRRDWRHGGDPPPRDAGDGQGDARKP